MTRSAGPYDVATVIPADYPDLSRFLAEPPSLGGGREWWLSRFALWWDENPAFRPEAPRGWMLRGRGRLCGFLAHVPSLMLVNGKPRTVFSVSTWMVRPEHREASLELILRQIEASRNTLLFDTTPTEHVAEILVNMGFERLPWGDERESFIALEPEACLRGRFQRLSFVPKFAWAAAGRILGRLQARRLRALRPDPALRVAEARDAGPEFDRLWERTAGACSVTNVRTAAALRWHCFSDRYVEKRLYAGFLKDELAGYMIMKGRTRRGLKVLECVDWWGDPAVPAAFETLLSFIRGRAAAQGFDLLTFGHFSQALGAALRRAGLLEARLGPRRNLCLVGSGCQARLSGAASYFVGLQGDYGTSP